jgi:hypothetical protein
VSVGDNSLWIFVTNDMMDRRMHGLCSSSKHHLLEPSRYLSASCSRIRALISFLAHLWLGCSIIPVRVLHTLQSLGNYNGEGLRSHAYGYATRPIAEMPRIDGDGFCLAAPLAVSQITPCRLVRMLDGTKYASATSSAKSRRLRR